MEAPYRRLTEDELQDKREKGICYRCDERFFVGHRCKNRQFQVLLVEDNKDDRTLEEVELESNQPSPNEEAELSLNYVVGISTPRTMKLRGTIANQEVVVLNDCGASHNFISAELADKLRLPSVGTHSFKVLMGTGLSVKGVGLCIGVVVQLQNIKIVANFLPLKLGSADVILGMHWLETLERMQVNWKTLTMRFQLNDTMVTLQGWKHLKECR